MFDLYRSIRNKHCGWCDSEYMTWCERRWNGYHGEISFIGNVYWRWVELGTKIGLWKIAAAWHYRYHDDG